MIITKTVLAASPDPATAGQPVTLTARVVPAGGIATPAGTVQFWVGGSAIGTPATVSASGTASVSATFATAGLESVSAVFAPATPARFRGSAGALCLAVNPPSTTPPNDSGIPLAVVEPSTGTFTLTVQTATVTLAVTGLTVTAITSYA